MGRLSVNEFRVKDGGGFSSALAEDLYPLYLDWNETVDSFVNGKSNIELFRKEVGKLYKALCIIERKHKLIAESIYSIDGFKCRFGKKRLRALEKDYDVGQLFFIPGVAHDDPRFLLFKKNLVKRLNSECEVTMGADGLLQSFFPSNFDKILTITGDRPESIYYPCLNAERNRRQVGCKRILLAHPALKSHAKQYIKAITALKVTDIVDIEVQGSSSSCGPDGASGKLRKAIRFCHGILNGSEVAQLIRERSWNKLIEEYACYPSFHSNYRAQSDKPGKKRTGVQFNDIFRIDAVDVVWDNISKSHESFCTQRIRTIKGGDGVTNAILQCFFKSLVHRLYKEYPDTFKVSTGADLQERMRRLEERGVRLWRTYDVSQFDACSSPDFNKLLNECLRDEFGDDFADTYEALRRAPTLYRSSSKGGTIRVSGKIPNSVEPSLQSGIASVSFSGIFENGLNYYLLSRLTLHRVGILDINNTSNSVVNDFLHHRLPIVTFNKGDDHVIGFSDERIREAFDEVAINHSEFKLEVEPAMFVGYTLRRGDDGLVYVSHNPVSFLTNQLSPERGFFDIFNKLIAYGNVARRLVYSDSPVVGKLQNIMDEEFSKVFPEIGRLSTRFEVLSVNQLEQHLSDVSVSSLTSGELEFIRDPTVIKWKDVGPIREELLNALVTKIPTSLIYSKGDSKILGVNYVRK